MIWAMVCGDVCMLWFALRHPAAPSWLKWSTLLIVLCVLSPIDLVPDFIPVLGALDDIVLVPLAVRFLLKRLPAQIAESESARRSR